MFWILIIAGLIVILDITGFKADEETINVIYSQDGEGEQNSASTVEPKEEPTGKEVPKESKAKKTANKEEEESIQKPQRRVKTEAKQNEFVDIEVEDEELTADALDALNKIY